MHEARLRPVVGDSRGDGGATNVEVTGRAQFTRHDCIYFPCLWGRDWEVKLLMYLL